MFPTAYHLRLRDWLRTHEPELWSWFARASGEADRSGLEEYRLGLLKSAYRLDAAPHAGIHAETAAAADALGISAPVTLWQANDAGAPVNASVAAFAEEIHIVFSGPILQLLTPLELRSVLGHELAHLHLWKCEGGDLRVAERLLHAAASDPRANGAHLETARRWRLSTELYADRGALTAVGDLAVAVTALVKAETGLREASGESYLRQAEEILARSTEKSAGLTHPELYLRARALALWHERGAAAEAEIEALLAGPTTLAELDLPGQALLVAETRQLLHEALQPLWGRSELRLAHARSFFPDFDPAVGAALPEDAFAERPVSQRDYAAAVLFDFASVDPDLDRIALAHALVQADRLGVAKEFDRLAAKELGLKVRDLKQRRTEAPALLAREEAAA